MSLDRVAGAKQMLNIFLRWHPDGAVLLSYFKKYRLELAVFFILLSNLAEQLQREKRMFD